MSATLTTRDVDVLIAARNALASGEAIRLREQAGLSQRQVAAHIRVTHVAVGRWERGQRSPRGSAGLRYARFLARLAEQLGEDA